MDCTASMGRWTEEAMVNVKNILQFVSSRLGSTIDKKIGF
jgi:hypothetical protein